MTFAGAFGSLAVLWQRFRALRGWVRRACVLAALVVVLPAGSYAGVRVFSNLRPPPAAAPPREIAPGISYERRVDPNVPRVEHWARVQLDQVELVMTPADDEPLPVIGERTSSFAAREGLHLAINGGFFEPWEPGLVDPYPKTGERVAPVGFAAHRGHVYGAASPNNRTLYVNEDGSTSFVRPARVWNALSGGCMLVEHGQIGDPNGCPFRKLNDERHPRTAIGLTEDKRTLILLVVDGRQRKRSIGATLAELAELLLKEGAFDALNLDGGGSSVLVARSPAGEIELLSTPISAHIAGYERVVGTHLGVRAKAER